VTQTAKLFINGRSQAVRLPKAFRFDGTEVFIRKDPATGDVVLSPKPKDWASFFAAYDPADIPDDFMRPEDRQQEPATRDPFEGYEE